MESLIPPRAPELMLEALGGVTVIGPALLPPFAIDWNVHEMEIPASLLRGTLSSHARRESFATLGGSPSGSGPWLRSAREPCLNPRPVLVVQFQDGGRHAEIPPAAWIDDVPVPRIAWIPGTVAVFGLPRVDAFLRAVRYVMDRGRQSLRLRVEFGALAFAALLVISD